MRCFHAFESRRSGGEINNFNAINSAEKAAVAMRETAEKFRLLAR